jgi:hypothetical protein
MFRVVQINDFRAPGALSLSRVLLANKLVLRKSSVLAIKVAAMLTADVRRNGVEALEEGSTGVQVGEEVLASEIPLVAMLAVRFSRKSRACPIRGYHSLLLGGLGETALSIV